MNFSRLEEALLPYEKQLRPMNSTSSVLSNDSTVERLPS
jgi:hypothetical protein